METKNKSAHWLRLDRLDLNGNIDSSHELTKEKIVLGRILSADLRIDHAKVSRLHALLETRADRWILTDLTSSHGTFVNGEKVQEREVHFGDIIRLGEVELRLEHGSGQAIQQTELSATFFEVPLHDTEPTLVDIDRSTFDRRSKAKERRQVDAFPDEKRLEERRQGDRRFDVEPRPALSGERRLGERRRADRRVFDITSLERRIKDRRTPVSDNATLALDLEQAFQEPEHHRELEVTALWGDHILEVNNYNAPGTLYVGESARCDYIIPSVGIPDEFPLVNLDEDGSARLSWTREMTGTIRTRGKIYSLHELASKKFVSKEEDGYAVNLREEDFAKLAIGTVNFFHSLRASGSANQDGTDSRAR